MAKLTAAQQKALGQMQAAIEEGKQYENGKALFNANAAMVERFKAFELLPQEQQQNLNTWVENAKLNVTVVVTGRGCTIKTLEKLQGMGFIEIVKEVKTYGGHLPVVTVKLLGK